ncbi:unnamed protein product [Dibothriocephalus latus]|uniref:Uncharacterized protein n=1 Tax=Dibothriocephalus latus TaxID=60516 RepID=A0A3P7LPY7_DIBLA|nr:unnamed protein product [Dibothriocephalus latus]
MEPSPSPPPPVQTTAPRPGPPETAEARLTEFKRMLEENCERMSQEEAHLEDLLNRSRTIERDVSVFNSSEKTHLHTL